jgi:hypothetical protein
MQYVLIVLSFTAIGLAVAVLLLLRKAECDPIWGVRSRFALERRMARPGQRRDLAVVDIAGMGKLNRERGGSVLDSQLRRALTVRGNDTIDIYRFKAGDELVIDCPAGALPRNLFALRDALAQFDIQMTACVALNAEPSIDLLNRLSDAVDAEKATGRRGTTVEYLTTLQSVAA